MARPTRMEPGAQPKTHAQACDRLWEILREDAPRGLIFHARERLGPFVVDFVCPAARLVLLIDDGQASGDAASWLHENGYRVLEFPAGEVLNNPRFILDAITQSFELRIVARKS